MYNEDFSPSLKIIKERLINDWNWLVYNYDLWNKKKEEEGSEKPYQDVINSMLD